MSSTRSPQRKTFFPDDPEGPGSWKLGCLYAVVGAPFIVGTITGIAALVHGVGASWPILVGITAFFGLVGGYCATRLRYWWMTALARRVDRHIEAGASRDALRLESVSASAPTAVPSHLKAASVPKD